MEYSEGFQEKVLYRLEKIDQNINHHLLDQAFNQEKRVLITRIERLEDNLTKLLKQIEEKL